MQKRLPSQGDSKRAASTSRSNEVTIWLSRSQKTGPQAHRIVRLRRKPIKRDRLRGKHPAESRSRRSSGRRLPRSRSGPSGTSGSTERGTLTSTTARSTAMRTGAFQRLTARATTSTGRRCCCRPCGTGTVRHTTAATTRRSCNAIGTRENISANSPRWRRRTITPKSSTWSNRSDIPLPPCRRSAEASTRAARRSRRASCATRTRQSVSVRRCAGRRRTSVQTPPASSRRSWRPRRKWTRNTVTRRRRQASPRTPTK